ncbi:g3453 [Coccomyxa elongata]
MGHSLCEVICGLWLGDINGVMTSDLVRRGTLFVSVCRSDASTYRVFVRDILDRLVVVNSLSKQVIQTEELDPEVHARICASVQERETRRLELLDHIHETMERYCWVLDLLVNGDFCALQSIANTSVKRWDLKRQDNGGVRYIGTTCPGVYVDRLIERLQKEAEGLDLRSLYDMRSPENREWQELINTFTDAMSRGIRLLGGCEFRDRNTLKIDVL